MFGEDGLCQSKRNVDGEIATRCEAVCRNLWVTLSELAFDPHHLDASIYRISYEKYYELVRGRAALIRYSHTEDIGDSYDLPRIYLK